MKPQLKNDAQMIDAIADCLIDDHIKLMNENAELRTINEALTASLSELLDEYHPRECWSDDHIEYETQQGNMMAPIVKRAFDSLAKAKNYS
jgi:hypothetical protein